MLIDLFNPFKVMAALKRSNRLYLLALMLSPFLEPVIYGHFSIVLAVIGVGAFFMIVHTVVIEADRAEEGQTG